MGVFQAVMRWVCGRPEAVATTVEVDPPHSQTAAGKEPPAALAAVGKWCVVLTLRDSQGLRRMWKACPTDDLARAQRSVRILQQFVPADSYTSLAATATVKHLPTVRYCRLVAQRARAVSQVERLLWWPGEN